jgi:hypothetical protein
LTFFLFKLVKAGIAAPRYLALQIDISSFAHFMARVVSQSRGFSGAFDRRMAISLGSGAPACAAVVPLCGRL